MTARLTKKIAIVTGGAGAIGSACVRRFVAEGARVAIFDLARQADAGEAIAADLGEDAVFVACDVTNPGECAEAVTEVAGRFGAPDVLVNNAGIAITGGLEEISEEDWDRTFSVNVKSIYLLGREVLPRMRQAGGGSMINIASESAFLGIPMHPAYCASKAAVVHLSRCLAVRHASDRIRVNALCPGTIDTPLYRNFLDQQEDAEAVHNMVIDMHPLGLGTADDIAMAAVYLASDESRYVTGAPMLVDGGSTAR